MDALLDATFEADPGLRKYRTTLAAVARAATHLAKDFYSAREVDDDSHAPCDEAA